MPQPNEILYWEPETEKDEPISSWMLIDWHRDGQIVAGAGSAYSVGERISARLLAYRGVGTWMREWLADTRTLIGLIPFEGARWLVFPHLYLATGCLFLTELPVPARYAVSIAESGALGEIAVFPGRGTDADPAGMGAMVQSCQYVLREALACVPQAEKTPGELYRILRAATARTGTRLSRTLTEERFCEAERKIASDRSDLALFATMLLMVLSALSRCHAGPLTLLPEQGEEGALFSFKVSSVQSGALLRNSAELAAARALAEQNCLVFDAAVRGRTFQGHMCVTRKDFALLGLKDDLNME